MPYVSSGEAKVWWDSVGEGSPVVLINGLSSPSAAWFRLVPELQSSFRVITVDNLGTGKTGVPPGPYTMTMLADAVAAVIKDAGEASAHILGISLGGLISQELALNHPELVRSLTLVSTHGGIPLITADPVVLEALTEAASLDGEQRYNLLLPFAHSAATPKAKLDEDCAVRAAHPTSEQGYNNQLLGVSTWERLSELPKIKAPTLVLHGAEDRMVPLSGGELLRDSIPGARMVVLEGADTSSSPTRPKKAPRLSVTFSPRLGDETQDSCRHWTALLDVGRLWLNGAALGISGSVIGHCGRWSRAGYRHTIAYVDAKPAVRRDRADGVRQLAAHGCS